VIEAMNYFRVTCDAFEQGAKQCHAYINVAARSLEHLREQLASNKWSQADVRDYCPKHTEATS
jgi:hypothetical protein